MDTKQRKRPGDTPKRQRPAPQSRRPAPSERRQGDVHNPRNPQNQADLRKRAEAKKRAEAQKQAEARQRAEAQKRAEERKQTEARREAEAKKRAQYTPEAVKRAKLRRKSAERTKERLKRAVSSRRAPAVVYTDPKPLNRRQLILQLVTVLAVVLALIVGISIFFKVGEVRVYGNNAYSAWAIREASGIEDGENLLTLGTTSACGKIKQALPYVDTVRIGIKLPDTVNIYIKEHEVVYAIKSSDGTWWLMTSEGKIVEQTDGGTAGNHTQILGVVLDAPEVGQQANPLDEAAPVVTETVPEGETQPPAPPVVSGRERLDAVLAILSSMELNDIVGKAANVNVSNLSQIELWYGNRYQVKLGDTSQLDYKITCMKQSIEQLQDYQMGVLDISFTTWPDQCVYTPFE